MRVLSKNKYNQDKRRWFVQLDNDEDDTFMGYDCVVKYADEEIGTICNFKLPANPIFPP